MLLFQCGVYDFSGEELFEFELVRQLCVGAVDAEGHEEYDHMEQLRCTWYFAPTAELRLVEFNRWADEEAPISAFFSEVESHPIYHMLKEQTPEKLPA